MARHTKGETRWLWIDALGHTSGPEAVPFLQGLLGDPTANRSVVPVALRSLKLRDPAGADRLAMRLLPLTSGKLALSCAIHLTAPEAEPSDLDALLTWMGARLADQKRHGPSGVDGELPRYAAFAVAHRRAATMATILQGSEATMTEQEHWRLEASWPADARSLAEDGAPVPGVNLGLLQAWAAETIVETDPDETNGVPVALADALAASWVRHRRPREAALGSDGQLGRDR